MKLVIFASGMGSRISEESHLRPKPMIEKIFRYIVWYKTYYETKVAVTERQLDDYCALLKS